jgi:tetratricopeptide (TPR) repeat protein
MSKRQTRPGVLELASEARQGDHAGMFIAALLFTANVAAAQMSEVTPQQLFESGKYQDAIEKIKARADAPPELIYLRALAHRKLTQNDEAKEVLGTLASKEEGSVWHEVGKSGIALVDGDLDTAGAAAKKAVEIDGGLPEAQYQLGLVESARNNQPQAAEAFAKAAEINPKMAYAHYEAGMAFYKIKRVDRMAVYFENFLKLAPNAPEKAAVQSIMKTVRGR